MDVTIIVDGEFRGTSRFRVIRRLGGGGFGIVYRVYDNKRRSEVALKTLKVANPRALYRFKKEFRALADVNHVNLVSLYELLSEEGVWFFTMELVDGPNFRDYVLGEPPPEASDSDVPTAQDATLDFSKSSAHDVVARAIRQAPTTDFIKLRHALKQLAEGLGALHRAGMLHRDIKPTNVRVTTNDRVVVLDFGLVTEADPHNMMHSVDFVGSPAYMSPEQGTGKPVSEAGDWYSVGVMLFEALTGQLPFFGGFTEVLLAKQQQEAPSPASLSSGVPDDLNQLCVGLLRRDPRDRIKGRDVLQLLGATTPPRRFVESVSSSHRSEMLYGRERHTAALATAFERALSGTPTTVLVRGRSGMGKTTLIETFLREIQRASSDVVALTGRCYQQELVPYKALDGLIDSLSRYLTRQNQLEAAMLMPRDILALARLFPVLRQVEVIDSTTSRGAPIADPHELRRRAFEALRELLARLADRKRVVLFIDDLQWGDDDSVSLLSQLLRPPSAPVLLLIVSHRDGPGHDNRLLQELFSTPSPGSEALDLHEITVGPLSPD
ncbi:MAG: serine/threonine-protein kinase PknK, partial [Myxococcales bacterium]|nr:serine/threonine-protein kinase PknK [Myxococcales bacterium]